MDWGIEGTRLGDRADLRGRESRAEVMVGAGPWTWWQASLRELGLGGAEHRGEEERS